MDVAEVGGEGRQAPLGLFARLIPSQQCQRGESMSIIPPAELSSLFRQPDYSGNGHSGALFPGGSRERVRIGGGIIRGY